MSVKKWDKLRMLNAKIDANLKFLCVHVMIDTYIVYNMRYNISMRGIFK